MDEITTIELLKLLMDAIECDDEQELINYYAKEVVNRLYNPVGAKQTYEETLYDYGFRTIVKRR